MKNSYINKKQQGMTIIEIMIALAIGAFLIAGVMQVYLGSRQSFRMLDSLSRMQENGRFAMEFISRDIRLAGFRECWTGSIPTPINGTNNDGLNNSDSITIQMSTSACPVVVLPITYTIANGEGGLPALFQNNGATNPELIEGIQDMQFLYGADTNGDNTPDYYVPAGTAGLLMNQVISIRVGLLLVSINDNIAAQPIPYTFNGVTTTPADRRLRRVFSTTVAIRNLLP